MRKGADNAYKEFKIATFYNESNEHRQVIATIRWDRPGADAIMALIALEQSNMWKSYWDVRKRAA